MVLKKAYWGNLTEGWESRIGTGCQLPDAGRSGEEIPRQRGYPIPGARCWMLGI
ncbi:hypothetical protein D1BOALGB6SA_3575 [Olavius sp. associated proteobacterium Delta 1]|nr:hypothetical protein D1BOALGB6SA_3575 [Olavius sp. associated proteobacterium Delta 1]